MLQETCQLSDSEIEFVTELVDEEQTGRVNYHALFYKYSDHRPSQWFVTHPSQVLSNPRNYYSKTGLDALKTTHHKVKNEATYSILMVDSRSVIVIVRHGARYPLKCFPNVSRSPSPEATHRCRMCTGPSRHSFGNRLAGDFHPLAVNRYTSSYPIDESELTVCRCSALASDFEKNTSVGSCC